MTSDPRTGTERGEGDGPAPSFAAFGENWHRRDVARRSHVRRPEHQGEAEGADVDELRPAVSGRINVATTRT
jgi:hypothetical protein